MDISQLSAKHQTGEAKWFDQVPDHIGLKIKVRSTNHRPYKDAMKKAGLRHNKAFNRGEGNALIAQIIAEHLLVDFDAENWTDLTANGEPLQYSKETALTLMTSEDDLGICQAFQNAVFECAKEFAEEQRENAKTAAGNSQTTTAGSKTPQATTT